MAKRTRAPSTIILLGMLRVVPAVVLGAVYLWMARFIDANGGRGVDWFGAALIAGLFGLGAVFTITRTFRRARAAAVDAGPAAPPPMPDEPAFDADAAIRRYLARKAPSGAPPGPDSPPQTFGEEPPQA